MIVRLHFPPPNLGFDFHVQRYYLPTYVDPQNYFSLRSHLSRCIYKELKETDERSWRGLGRDFLNPSYFLSLEDRLASAITPVARAATPPPWSPLAVAQLSSYTFVASVPQWQPMLAYSRDLALPRRLEVIWKVSCLEPL